MRHRRTRCRDDVHARAGIAEMIAHYLREASVLVLVFGFLDMLVGEEAPGRSLRERLDELPLDWIAVVLAVSMSLLAIGVVLERLRR